MDADYLTPSELAAELGLQSAETIYRRLRSGALRSELVGGRHRIARRDAEALKRRVSAKRSSPSYRQTTVERRAAVRERFSPVAGLPGASS